MNNKAHIDAYTGILLIAVLVTGIFFGSTMMDSNPFREQTETEVHPVLSWSTRQVAKSLEQYLINQDTKIEELESTIKSQEETITTKQETIDEMKSTDYYTKWQTAMNENKNIEERVSSDHFKTFFFIGILYLIAFFLNLYMKDTEIKKLNKQIKSLKKDSNIMENGNNKKSKEIKPDKTIIVNLGKGRKEKKE